MRMGMQLLMGALIPVENRYREKTKGKVKGKDEGRSYIHPGMPSVRIRGARVGAVVLAEHSLAMVG